MTVEGCLFRPSSAKQVAMQDYARQPDPIRQAVEPPLSAEPDLPTDEKVFVASKEEVAIAPDPFPAKSESWLAWATGETYEEAWKAVVRPYRDVYKLEQLGPAKFSMKGNRCRRMDVDLRNVDGHTLKCSHFVPGTDPNSSWPCVVYLHGNSSSRLEAHDVVKVCVPRKLGVFCFDFSGCGLSGGDYVTLGHKESKDLGVVLDYLRGTGKVTSIGLWGRSMGAATAIIGTGEHNVQACVLDSPFTRLRLVVEELLTSRLSIPKFILNLGIEAVRQEIQNRARFDLNEVVPVNAARVANCPAFFGASTEDDLIQVHHSQDLHDAWGHRDKIVRIFNGDHNAKRPAWFMKEAGDWLLDRLTKEPVPMYHRGSRRV